MKACIYTRHARDQMRRRNVPLSGVEYVLSHYDTHRPAQPRTGARPAEIYIGTYDGRRLKVHVEIESDPPKVKTAAWADE
ncbi:MAG: DUF4258 domain-containing protein [Dehalococcoidia bacterium]|nr:DUF4258 domain-containing protein [Dehalococcoidia bacterium]